MKEGEREREGRGRGVERVREGGREGERRERERGGESAEAGVRLTATPLPCPPERSDGNERLSE